MEKTTRPWGTYEVLLDDDNCKVKKITVDTSNQKMGIWLTIVNLTLVSTLTLNPGLLDLLIWPNEFMFLGFYGVLTLSHLSSAFFFEAQRRTSLKAYNQAYAKNPVKKTIKNHFSVELRPSLNGFSMAGTF